MGKEFIRISDELVNLNNVARVKFSSEDGEDKLVIHLSGIEKPSSRPGVSGIIAAAKWANLITVTGVHASVLWEALCEEAILGEAESFIGVSPEAGD
jgi:hypothetical protein